MNGKEWTRNSISIWSDIRKDAEEIRLKHPAVFPKALVRRCLDCFTTGEQRVVLDPFSGSGSTPLAAWLAGKEGIGFEINPDYVALTHWRREALLWEYPEKTGEIRIIPEDARRLGEQLAPESVDICITSPPYWNILSQRRSADYKPIRDYGDHEADLGRMGDYAAFLEALCGVFAAVYVALRPGAYCLINVMDLRKGPVFYPFHADLARGLQAAGFIWDDLIIWDRRVEYSNMRPLGYPTVFRINKAHEFILILQKPDGRRQSGDPT
ncbi:MAG: site-specific DNA-methyltransferase, partial [Armatimonadetes bacterium]|nr:site-specific DNA-methyltransferase [Armatimonadota bacterium]